jgi:hypothetical protein
MFHDQLFVASVGHHNEVLFWNNIIKSFVCMSDERLACSQYVQKLLWTALSAHWPKAGASATCHNYAVSVAIHR